MSQIAAALELIRRTSAEMGALEYARVSGVPYTTLRDRAANGFGGRTVETLIRLERAALASQGRR